MANESTYGTMSALIGNIYSLALQTAREMDVIAPLVTNWSGGDSRPRLWATYTGGTFASNDEATDATAQAFYASVAGTATPTTYVQQIFLTDRRMRTDPNNAVAEAGTHLGQTASAAIDTALCGTAIFGGLTAGTVGTAGSTATWANIFRAQAYLRTAKVMGDVFCVLHPVQWYYLVSASSGVPQLVINNSVAENLINRGVYMGSFGNINFIVDANIPSGTAAIGAMFSPQAIYLDTRLPFQIAPQRDESRAGGGVELNARLEYAYGIFRPTFGAQIVGTSS
jgi:hypothetical protein